ncbi:hypothetical protein C8J57DRAFT_1470336 [Mycena rebaudengoi]|nr:hypothetical protein C8J57DRAFT_1470336 [Mycena rebaudengoi]
MYQLGRFLACQRVCCAKDLSLFSSALASSSTSVNIHLGSIWPRITSPFGPSSLHFILDNITYAATVLVQLDKWTTPASSEQLCEFELRKGFGQVPVVRIPYMVHISYKWGGLAGSAQPFGDACGRRINHRAWSAELVSSQIIQAIVCTSHGAPSMAKTVEKFRITEVLLTDYLLKNDTRCVAEVLKTLTTQRNSRSSMDTYYYPTPSPSSHASSILAAALQMPTPPPPAIPPASSAASPLPVTRHNTPVGPAPVYKYYGLDYDESASTVDDVLQPLMLPSSPPRGYLDFLYRELSVEEDVFGPVRHITTESKPRFSAARITREKQHRTLMWVLRQRQDDRK